MTSPAKLTAEAAKLIVDDVSVVYRDKAGKSVQALSNVSFQVREGEFVSIVGPSGCGKSTLLLAADGLVPITSGEIRLSGRSVRAPGLDRAVVFQQANLLPWRTVLGNITYGLEMQGYAAAERQERAERIVGVVGLREFAHHYPHQLSGGMRQRVNLARALVCTPEVLLLDEPFAALDAQTRELMQAELLRIWESHRVTALFITHQIDEALYLSDRVLVMSARPGRVLEEIVVNIPRPRSLEVKQSPEFVRQEQHIWSMLRVEAAKAMV